MHISAVFWPILTIRRSIWGFLMFRKRLRHFVKPNYFILNSFIETADYLKIQHYYKTVSFNKIFISNHLINRFMNGKRELKEIT